MRLVAPSALGRDEAAADWAMRLYEGPLPPAADRELERWLDDDANRAALADAVAVWECMDAVAAQPEVLRHRADALEQYREANRGRWSAGPRRWRAWPAVAAGVLVGIALLALLLGRAPLRYDTRAGERQVAMLADGSRLSLDGSTSVEVRIGGDRRALTLRSGRAKFDVASDPLRPFSVAAGDKIVVASGTAFSVELVGRQVRVVLYEGHVRVVDARRADDPPTRPAAPGSAGEPDRLLEPGLELVMLQGKPDVRVAPVDPVRSLAWEEGQLSFDDEPLALAVARVNRHAATELAVGGAEVSRLGISGVFQAGDTDAFVEAASSLLPVRAERTETKILLRRRRPQE